jgi:membrane associated rhomboid family serine protease
MIIPWLQGILRWQKAPLTWTLLVLNCLFFLTTMDLQNSHNKEFVSDQNKFELTAKLYSQYKGGKRLPAKSELISLGTQALRDSDFINNADKIQFRGDQIEIQDWKNQLQDFREDLQRRPSQVFGLSWSQHRPLTWITYQFMHAGWMHLFGNMLLMVVFAGALELQIGSFGILFLYICSGLAGALGFLILGQATLAPMVGASASLSGMMAFYALYESKKRVPFIYFLTPVRGFYGKIWLPTWIIFPLFFIADLASYFGTVKELGTGIAYTAHIGGMCFGLLSGVLWKKWKESHVIYTP